MSRFISISVILITGIIVSHCGVDGVENPNYPVEPLITFKKIDFVEFPGSDNVDTLRLTIRYRDGDSDLGFDALNPIYQEYPYNDLWYFLSDGSGDTSRVLTKLVYAIDGSASYNLMIPGLETGKLVIDKTRNQPNYGYLPVYDPSSCNNYLYNEILVPQAEGAVDASYNVIDTLYDGNSNLYYLVGESFFYQRNENHYNIIIEFYKSTGDNTFTEFDWFEHLCIDFNGRFPTIGATKGTITSGPFKIKAITPWEGEIQYSMPSIDFLTVFGNTPLKLRITIKDLALHTSNTIETPVFTLLD